MKNYADDNSGRDELTGKIIGVFYDVYNELGTGFLESVYLNAMALALVQAGLKVAKESPVTVYFRSEIVGEFRADLIVEQQVICELKAAAGLEPAHEAQLLHYLAATEIEKGLLFNFGPEPQFQRYIYSNSRKRNLATDRHR